MKLLISILLVLGRLHSVLAMQVSRTWTTKHWCDSVVNPRWPFAYSKYKEQKEEFKGRAISNKQDMRHKCQARGVQSKCHICEDIECGLLGNASSQLICHFQLQGVSTELMSKNIPTITDAPWAVGGLHRYDYGGQSTSHICLHMAGGDCQSSHGTNYLKCPQRCWGYSSNSTNSDNESGAATRVHGEPTGVWPNVVNDSLNGVQMAPWLLPVPTQTWSYPKYSAELSLRNPRSSHGSSSPQGFTFTLAGDAKSGEAGFEDGDEYTARFRHPEGVAVDHMGYVFVADTGNHAIRMISPFGFVTTIAGNGKAGYQNGNTSTAQFTYPAGLCVWRDWSWWPYPNPIDNDSLMYYNGNGTLVLFVADTGNHQIRKVTLVVRDDNITLSRNITSLKVECFSGRCHTDLNQEMEPRPGYSDGSRGEARFDSPRGITVSHTGDVYVADTNNHLIRKIDRFGKSLTIAGSTKIAEQNSFATNNHLIRKIDRFGKSLTIAGSTKIAEQNSFGKELEGCPSPCLTGTQGQKDGFALDAKFSFPNDVVISTNQSALFVTDRHHIRGVDLRTQTVATLAGTDHESDRDGFGAEASFNQPEGIAVTADGSIFISDSASCRIRRAFYNTHSLLQSTCFDTLSTLFRPSGCSSYNTPTDTLGMKVTSRSHNIYYNYNHRQQASNVFGEDYIGRGMKDCVGSPPRRVVYYNETSTEALVSERLVINANVIDIREDPNEGTVMTVNCPPGCNLTIPQDNIVVIATKEGSVSMYTEDTPICIAAFHSSHVDKYSGGLVDVIITTLEPEYQNLNSSTTQAKKVLESGQFYKLVSSSFELSIHTISGAPSTLTESSCGFKDAIPSQRAKFRAPSAIATFANNTLNHEDLFLFVADTNNNVIRALTAACSFPCENKGFCVGLDKCECMEGWTGIDCTIPICSNTCEDRLVCVAPDQCACIPGYKGAICNVATCVQTCQHGGICSGPDTCTCPQGWFDTNCTTPVCEHTCGNGGNCTSPNYCTCPLEWMGRDCRIPVCQQECHNGGMCIASNTCQCPPDWSGFDCSQPVCHQGYFKAFSESSSWLEYKPCNMSAWCSETEAFECQQAEMVYTSTAALNRNSWRHKTGSDGCFSIELIPEALTWFQYLQSWNEALTPNARYSTPSSNNRTSLLPQEWNARTSSEQDRTPPFKSEIDRQIAYVQLVNTAQGHYRCANNGSCVAPDTCACAKGWMGFDCRVPICEQGYYEKDQPQFVKGTNDRLELDVFREFLIKNASYRLDPRARGYSNPTYFAPIEKFINRTHLMRSIEQRGGDSYLHNNGSIQGGYECSIRAVTEWENYRSGKLFEHPNFYSRYMDQKFENDGLVYTHWENMGWDPTYEKSSPLERYGTSFNITNDNERLFLYTDEGFRRKGEWSRTPSNWTKGRCIIEFRRVCDNGIASDLATHDESTSMSLVQDTDLSFRPRLQFNDTKEIINGGTWQGGPKECIDHVIRGCFNNGTCIGPNLCNCARGWTGHDCTTPICEQECLHNGNCTLANVCTCERGWSGRDCSTALCAQECSNGGVCVAPDTCKCYQWNNLWRDGRVEGGVPMFQKPNGDPQLTGWTGYDCSTPICVQAESFIHNVNIDSYNIDDLLTLGGHGRDGKLLCDDVRCPAYDAMVLSNDGKSFQTGCGNDPILSGCCYQADHQSANRSTSFVCMKCDPSESEQSLHSTRCPLNALESFTYIDISTIPLTFKERDGRSLKQCGPIHSPGGPNGIDYHISDYPFATPYWSNRNYESRSTSSQYLCSRHEWSQGDYRDNAIIGNETSPDTDQGLQIGRHIRVNYNNYNRKPNSQKWAIGDTEPGEGIFACYNGGSCIAPDFCTCKDGYTGFDCNTPLCRHRQNDGTVAGCLNGGVCADKDNCHCVHTQSILWIKHLHADRGITGWTGQDCSTPICSQGYFDPVCEERSAASGGEGCYRCANGGMCVAPDICECNEGWKGFNCETPICEAEITVMIRKQLMTSDENKVHLFEKDPCAMEGFDSRLIPHIMKESRGKCILPNTCVCNCRASYSRTLCRLLGGKYCVTPFQDPYYRHRNVLAPNEIFGTRSCNSGFEGAVDEKDKFISCHLSIYEPTFLVNNTKSLIGWCAFSTLLFIWIFVRTKRRRHSKYMVKRYERRELRRDGVVPTNHAFAFNSRVKDN